MKTSFICTLISSKEIAMLANRSGQDDLRNDFRGEMGCHFESSVTERDISINIDLQKEMQEMSRHVTHPDLDQHVFIMH